MAKEVKKAATKESAPNKAAAKEPAKKVATKEPAKKPAVKEIAPAETAAKSVVGKYRVDCVYGDLYQFYLYANNGQLLYESREYASKKSCLEGIETFKKNMQDAQRPYVWIRTKTIDISSLSKTATAFTSAKLTTIRNKPKAARNR